MFVLWNFCKKNNSAHVQQTSPDDNNSICLLYRLSFVCKNVGWLMNVSRRWWSGDSWRWSTPGVSRNWPGECRRPLLVKTGRDLNRRSWLYVLLWCTVVYHWSFGKVPPFTTILWIWLWYTVTYKFIGPFSGWCGHVSLNCGGNGSWVNTSFSLYRERELRERQLAERDRQFRERERELREKEFRERQRREALEQELRQREAREKELRERERKLKEQHEREIREREIKMQREKEMRDREARANVSLCMIACIRVLLNLALRFLEFNVKVPV